MTNLLHERQNACTSNEANCVVCLFPVTPAVILDELK